MPNFSGGSVVWNLDADTSKLDSKLATARSQVDSFSKDQAKSFQSVENKAGKSFAAYGAAVAAAGAATAIFAKQSIEASASVESSLTGLSSIAGAFGQNVQETTQAAQALSSDGLLPLSDSAAGLKNLLATGFSLDEAINLMNAFRDAAAFNRQGTLAFGEAIVGATQGIKNQNSILVDNVGISKNLSVILREQGLSVNDLQNVTSDASVRQKLYNGLLQEGAVFSGDAAKSTQTLSGQMTQLSTNIFNVKAAIGDVLRVGFVPLLQGMNETISANPQLAAAFAVAIGAAVSFSAAIVGLVATIKLAAIIIGGPITIALAALSALLGGVVFKAVRKVQEKMNDTSRSFGSDSKDIANTARGNLGGKASEAAEKLAEKLGDIDRQIEKTKRNFKEQLAEIVRDSKEKTESIKRQLDDEADAYDESQGDRDRDFKRSQDDQVRAHQDRVDGIKDQIKDEAKKSAERVKDLQEDLRRENEAYSRSQIQNVRAHEQKVNDIKAQIDEEIEKGNERVSELEAQLEKENQEYKLHFDRLEDDYKRDTQRAKAAYEEKKSGLEAELQAEIDLQTKHASDVASVKDFQYRDEIEKLKDSHTEQLAEFDRQKERAIKSAKDTTTGIAGQLNSLPGQIDDNLFAAFGDDLGSEMGKAFKDGLIEAIKEIPGDIAQVVGGLAEKLGDSKASNFIKDVASSHRNAVLDFFGLRAEGGPVDAGSPYIVGEKGPEIIVPDRAGTVIPNHQLQGMRPVNITNNNNVSSEIDLDLINRKMSFQAIGV